MNFVCSTSRFSQEEKAKRQSDAHIPFGMGPRNCIGSRFALLQVKMMVIQMLRVIKFVQAPDTEVCYTYYVHCMPRVSSRRIVHVSIAQALVMCLCAGASEDILQTDRCPKKWHLPQT